MITYLWWEGSAERCNDYTNITVLGHIYYVS
jgi:hypothetical protein